jgi:mRNA interferase MazF
VRRGDVYDVRFDPIEGSEAAGRRPAVIVSRESFNVTSPNVIVVPCTRHREGRRLYPSQVLLRAGHGGLDADTIAQGELVRSLSKGRLLRHRGALSERAMVAVSAALVHALDLA